MECWVVTDGRAGIENQALGLAEAVARLAPLDVVAKRIRVPQPWRSLPGWLWGDPLDRLGKDGALLRPPYPSLVVACGRLAAPVAAAIKARNPRTFVVQLQNPRMSPARFDLVVPPAHDRLSGANVFSIVGSPHRATRARIAEEGARLEALPAVAALPRPRVAVLLGGPNRAYRFGAREGASLGVALVRLAAVGAGLMITTSRRTSPDALAAIRAALAGAPHFLWNAAQQAEPGNPYFGMLGAADRILVTADSVNMAGEAAITGKPVYILSLPRRLFAQDRKFRRFREALATHGATRPYTGALDGWAYEPLDETARAAAEVLRRLEARGGASA